MSTAFENFKQRQNTIAPESAKKTSAFDTFKARQKLVDPSSITTQSTEPKKSGLLKDIAAGIVKPFARLGTNILNAGQIAVGKEKTQPFSGDFLGEVKPVGQEGSFGEKLKDSVGVGLQVASNLPVVKGAGLTLNGIKTAFQQGTKQVLKTAAPLALEGAFGGGSYGTGKALEDQKSIPRAIGEGLLGAAGGAVTAPVLGFGLSAASGVAGIASKKLASLLDPEVAAQQVESKVIQKYEKGVRPTLGNKNTPTQVQNYRDNVVSAVKTIKENSPNLKFNDENGIEIAGQTPRSLQQLSDSIDQTKKTVFQKYNNLAKQAGEAGIQIETKPIAKELQSVVDNKALQLTNPNAVKYAKATQARYAKAGKLDAQTAQDVIQNYNKSLEAFYKNPSYDNASQAAIDALVANNMRKSLDEGITGLTGEQYGVLKRQYGALKSIEKDVIKASLRDARKSTKGLIDFTDIFSGGNVINGILTLNPTQVGAGLTQKGIATFYKYLNNPNRAIEKMFLSAEKLPQETLSKSAQTTIATSPSKNINMRTSIQKPKAKSKLPSKPPKLGK